MASWYRRFLPLFAVFLALCFVVPTGGTTLAAGEAVAQIARGGTLFLKADGTLWGMYSDLWPDLDTRDASADKFFLLMTNVKSIEPGGRIALLQNGAVWQWYDGSTGLPSKLLPTPLLRATGVKHYAGSGGGGTNGEKGYFITEDDTLWSLHPLEMREGYCVMEQDGPPQRLLKNVRSIVLSYSDIKYAVTHDNRLWVWGNNHEELKGNSSNYGSLVPQGKNTCKPFVARQNVRQVFVNTEQIVIQSTDGRMRRRGWNEKNYSMSETELFLPFTERAMPISNASYLECRHNGFFYLTDKHELRAYLYNDYTPTPCGPQFDRTDARPADARGLDVPFFEDVTDFSAVGGAISTILKRDGTVLACGFNWDRAMKIKTFDYYSKGYQPLELPPTPENPVGLLDPAIEKILGEQ
jgi:hypothetical protein